MKYLFSAILLACVLSGCQTPGVTIPVGDPIATIGPDGKVHSTPASAIKINADVMGDIDSPFFKLTTPKDGAGNFAYTEIPVTLKDGTVVVIRQPMVAQIKTASVWDAIFHGAKGVVDSVGGWVAAAVGLNQAGAVLGPVGSAAGSAIAR